MGCGLSVLPYCGFYNMRILFLLQKCLLARKMISLVTLLVLSCLQLESGCQEEPFILPSGEHYRDLITVRTASLAAAFAKRFQTRVSSRAWRIRDNLLREVNSERTPVFLKTNSISQLARKGRIMSDEEIFDFTDSRFLNPPRENIRNHPTVKVMEVEGQRFVTPSPPLNPEYSHPPRRRPAPQPIFKLPESFVNFWGKSLLSHLSPSPTPVNVGYRQIFKPRNKYIKTLQPTISRKGPRKVFFYKLSK